MNYRTKVYLENSGIAFSLANLCFFRQWYGVSLFAPIKGSIKDFNRIYPSTYFGLMLNVCLLAVVFFVVLWYARKSAHTKKADLIQWGVFAFLLIPLNFFRFLYNDQRLSFQYIKMVLGGPLSFALLIFVLGFLFLLAIRYSSILLVCVRRALLICLPFAALTFFRAGQALAHAGIFSNKISIVASPEKTTSHLPRFLWILFDGFDYRLAYSHRPQELSLPEFDSFRRESVFATEAYPPTSCTQTSVPALLTGKVNADGSKANLAWDELPNLPQYAKQLGFKTGLFGWYFPYCNLLSEYLDFCHHTPGPNLNVRPRSPYLAESMINGFFNFFVGELRFKDEWFFQYLHIQNYKRMLSESLKVIGDPSVQFLILHWPIPHPPWIYDKNKKDFTLTNLQPSGLLDNMALADMTLGEIRNKLTSAKLWDATTVLVSSDHWSHESYAYDGKVDHHIPWMLKLAYSKKAAVYPSNFNTIASFDLIKSLLKDEIKMERQLISWLDENAPHNLPPQICSDDPEFAKGLQSPM